MERTVKRPSMIEITALGSAIAAGLAVGVWESLDEARAMQPCSVYVAQHVRRCRAMEAQTATVGDNQQWGVRIRRARTKSLSRLWPRTVNFSTCLHYSTYASPVLNVGGCNYQT
eukprot:2755089-Rhodomonas_salina.2